MQRCSRPRCPSFSLLFRTGKNIDNSSWSNSIAIAVVTPKCICTRSLPLFHAFACRFTYTVGLPLHPILYNFSPLPSQLKQVHEKGVLFPSLAVCLLPSAVPKTWKPLTWILALHFQGMSLFSMWLGVLYSYLGKSFWATEKSQWHKKRWGEMTFLDNFWPSCTLAVVANCGDFANHG